MKDLENIAKHHKIPKSLCGEDYLVLAIIISCTLGPVSVLFIAKLYQVFIPSAFYAVFLGIAVASMLYRFLGGIHDATFAIGALKVTGSAAVLLGMAWWLNDVLEIQIAKFNRYENHFQVLEKKILENKKLEASVTDLNNKLNIANMKVISLEARLDKEIKIPEIVKLIKTLDPEDNISREIRNIALSKIGPWSPVSSTRTMMVSVAGYLHEGEIASCPEYFDKTIEVVSEYVYAGEFIRSSSAIILKVNKYISRANDCSARRDFQLQFNCQDAVKVFTSKVLECSEENIPKWKVEDRKLPISAVLIVKQM
ncbi:MAG: hypothetical protein AB2708_02955 [Candidatus Thiodiazotropha taylori]